MTFLGWAQIALFCLVVVALARPLGGYMTRVFAGERTLLSPVLGRSSAGSTALAGVDPARRAALGDLRARHAAVQPGWAAACSTRCSGCRRVLPLNPQGLARGRRPTSRSTPRSASSPTPTGRPTAARRTMSYLSQMAGLAVHNFVSAATGIALAVALVRGFARAARPAHRQLLGRPHPRAPSTSCCRSRSSRAVPGLAGRAAELRRLRRRRRRSRARKQVDRAGSGRLAGGDQDAGHQRRRLLQRQLGPSFENPTALTNFVADAVDLRARRRR